MADLFELAVETRTSLGKGGSRRLRREAGKVPAVVYGAGKDSTSVMINQHQFGNALKNEAFYSHILTLKVDGAAEKVVLKALQRHPSKPQILHADFQRVSATEKLTMTIPFHFINEDIAPGVKLQKGVISHLMNEVEIRCLPADLPEFIEVDLKELELDQSLHLSDLKVPKGVELLPLMHQDDRSVVNIHTLQVIEEPDIIEIPSAEVPLVGEEAKAEGEEAGKDKE